MKLHTRHMIKQSFLGFRDSPIMNKCKKYSIMIYNLIKTLAFPWSILVYDEITRLSFLGQVQRRAQRHLSAQGA